MIYEHKTFSFQAGYGTFLAASVNLPFQSNALAGAMAAGFHSRTLLNVIFA